MDVGLVFPQLEIGSDPERIREYARRAEDRGFEHLLLYDHVLGVEPRDGWSGSYDVEDQFHEVLTTLAHLAAVTEEISLVTGVLVLPQRNAAVVAKQTAQVDVLSGGRLRVGVGVGWNDVEYRALGADFSTRGRRVEEQLAVLERLHTEECVEFEGEFHELPRVGIRPLPVQRPVPVWLGGSADPVLDRIVRRAEGWMPPSLPPSGLAEELDHLEARAEARGRDPETVGLHPRVTIDRSEDWLADAHAWAEYGADYLGVNAMYRGYDPEDHVRSVDDLADELGEAGLL